jgi:hypothetical protein
MDGTIEITNGVGSVSGVRPMKKEYDFSKGERGKFYRRDVELNFPVYLEPQVADFVRSIAKGKDAEVETIVNDWLKRDIELIRSTR